MIALTSHYVLPATIAFLFLFCLQLVVDHKILNLIHYTFFKWATFRSSGPNEVPLVEEWITEPDDAVAIE